MNFSSGSDRSRNWGWNSNQSVEYFLRGAKQGRRTTWIKAGKLNKKCCFFWGVLGCCLWIVTTRRTCWLVVPAGDQCDNSTRFKILWFSQQLLLLLLLLLLVCGNILFLHQLVTCNIDQAAMAKEQLFPEKEGEKDSAAAKIPKRSAFTHSCTSNSNRPGSIFCFQFNPFQLERGFTPQDITDLGDAVS